MWILFVGVACLAEYCNIFWFSVYCMLIYDIVRTQWLKLIIFQNMKNVSNIFENLFFLQSCVESELYFWHPPTSNLNLTVLLTQFLIWVAHSKSEVSYSVLLLVLLLWFVYGLTTFQLVWKLSSFNELSVASRCLLAIYHSIARWTHGLINLIDSYSQLSNIALNGS